MTARDGAGAVKPQPDEDVAAKSFDQPETFARAGWAIPPPPATMFAWAPVPEPFKALGSVEFCKLLIEKAEIAVSPGLGFGEYGEGHIRIALVENEQRIKQAGRNLKKFLAQAQETMHNVIPIPQKASR